MSGCPALNGKSGADVSLIFRQHIACKRLIADRNMLVLPCPVLQPRLWITGYGLSIGGMGRIDNGAVVESGEILSNRRLENEIFPDFSRKTQCRMTVISPISLV